MAVSPGIWKKKNVTKIKNFLKYIDFLLFKNFISRHMIKLGKNFSNRFEKCLDNELGWIRHAFSFHIFNSDIPLNEKDQ